MDCVLCDSKNTRVIKTNDAHWTRRCLDCGAEFQEPKPEKPKKPKRLKPLRLKKTLFGRR